MKYKEIISLLLCDVTTKLRSKFPNFLDAPKFYNSKILEKQEGSDNLKDLLQGCMPICVCRYGTVEAQAVYKYLHLRNGLRTGSPILPVLCNNAGFFPNDQYLYEKFAQMMLEYSKDIDLLAVTKMNGEDYLANHFCTNATLTRIGTLDPIHGWTEALEGKKVLVISPFTETIEKQYKEHRDKIFEGTNLLPEFELCMIKAVQTVAGEVDDRFNNWFEALDWMTDEAAKIDFDIAIIGCGAYGLPLAVRIKRMGKKAVHMGGAHQLLFGIRGARWDNNPFISKYYNEFWTRPSESERPKNANKVEGACYW